MIDRKLICNYFDNQLLILVIFKAKCAATGWKVCHKITGKGFHVHMEQVDIKINLQLFLAVIDFPSKNAKHSAPEL